MKFTKQTLSVLAIAAFFLMAVASTTVKIQTNQFSSKTAPEDKVESTYLVLNDGSHVTGKKITWTAGVILKDQIKIDNQKFKFAEVRGYMQNGIYRKRSGSDFLDRLVHGKINIYRDISHITTTSGHSNTPFIHYMQRGENGPLIIIANKKNIKEAVSDCPLSLELASLSDREMKKALKSNGRYLNEIFEVYNNDCKPLR